MVHRDHAENAASGFTCPACGGALWTRQDDTALQFVCRIGDAYSAAQLWIEHSAARNRTLKHTARALAENAALARTLAKWGRERGNPSAAQRLEEEANDGEQLGAQVSRALAGLPLPEDETISSVSDL